VLIEAAKGRGLKGGMIEVPGNVSSQFITALLMVSPLASSKVTIKVKGELVSAPYVLMTINLMRKFNVTVTHKDFKTFEINPCDYTSPGRILVEGDASSTSYFLAGAAITGGNVTVRGCGEDSIQGDARFGKILEKMGATVKYGKDHIHVSRDPSVPLQGVEEDCGDIPDVAMTLALVGVFSKGKTMIKNVFNWRLKETERMEAMVRELTKLGVNVEEGRDYLVVHGIGESGQLRDGVEIETYDDHRMAMCFSLAACGGVKVGINNPDCVKKTFPNYFTALASLIES
jgi:3-phosphoshikimate 1-carboxyvinyltransferase